MTIEVYCAFKIDTGDILYKYEYIMGKKLSGTVDLSKARKTS
jgi:hypothetical protein